MAPPPGRQTLPQPQAAAAVPLAQAVTGALAEPAVLEQLLEVVARRLVVL